MDVSDARQKLTSTIRRELRDHSFGDAEVEWFHVDGQTVIAHGYFGRDGASFSFRDGSAHFTGDEARALRDAGIEGRVVRNDETGPDDYVEGQIMPGLTKEGVREEITRLREEGR